MLGKAMTNISPFISEANYNIEAEALFAKFKVTCTLFLRAMASDQHPVVVFLDEVQWADAGSKLLVDTFMQDAELKSVMLFILAYRDEEGEQIVDILECLRNPVDVGLSNLDLVAVHQMVCSLLKVTPDNEKIEELSALVAKRTAEHPYHVLVFIEFALQEGLLAFNNDTKTWTFDLIRVQEEVMVSENLAAFLTRKIDRLSSEIKETLKVASLCWRWS
jgi:histidine kinase